MIRVRALVNIRYDRDSFEIGEEFEVRKENLKEMIEKRLVEEVKEESVEES